jgi:hypothetical protein
MSLATYDEARPWAKAIKEEVLTRRMPKWQAARGYGDFSNDPSLSPFEIAVMSAWADGGAPRALPGDKSRGAEDKAPVSSGKAQAADGKPLSLPCGEQSLPEGTLLAVRPELQRGGSVGIAVRRPDGHRDIVAWIRNFDPDFPTTYWLRAPLPLTPGSTLVSDTRDRCTITVTVKVPR